MKPRLFVLSGPDLGRSLELSDGAILGRGADCTHRLNAASVSRRHARIECVDAQWFVVDLGARNGVQMGERRIERERLEDGALFKLGDVELRFRIEAEAPLAAAPPRGAEDAEAAPRVKPVESDGPIESEEPPEPADTLEDEIILEGDWEDEAPAAAPAPRAATPAPAARASSRPAPARARPAATPPVARASSSVAPSAAPSALAGSRAPLQYNRLEDRRGFLVSDLAQQPLWLRALVYLLVAALFGGLAWGFFRLTTSVRGTGPVSDPGPEGEYVDPQNGGD